MNIYGEKVVLRAVEKEDNALLLSLINDPEIEGGVGGSSFPVSSAQQERWFAALDSNDSVLRCVIADRENIEVALGTAILSDIDRKNGTAQIHIKLDASKFGGKGYGTDAVTAIVNYAFDEMRLNCVYAEILESNKRSQRLFEKCGFIAEGLLRSRVFKNGLYNDLKVYSIVKK